MANYAIAANQIGAYEKTMTANVVDTYTFDAQVSTVEIINHDGVSAIYATFNGDVPVVGGAGCYLIPNAVTADEFTINLGSLNVRPTVVKLISSGTPKVSVMRSDKS